MNTPSCILSLSNPTVESVSFFSNESIYSLLCKFSLRGKIRHALVKLSEAQWHELMPADEENLGMLSRLDSLRSSQSWVHLNLLHSYPELSSTNNLTFLIESVIEQTKPSLRLVKFIESGIKN